MEKASRALRRSSVKLMSIGGGNSDLHVLLSEVKDIRNSAKSFMNAQNAACQDMTRWAAHEENRAIQDVANQMRELNVQWTEIQKDFIESLKEYRQMFDMILEGEKIVSQAKNNLSICEHRETKVRKELKKAAKTPNHQSLLSPLTTEYQLGKQQKASSDEIRILETKLSQAERSKDVAEMEVSERIRENEAVKLIRLKEGLLRMSESYVELGNKCATVFEAQRNIAHQLPDVHGRDLEDIKYTGAGATQLYVQQCREKVSKYEKQSYKLTSPSRPSRQASEPPPPYSTSEEYLNNLSQTSSDGSNLYSPITPETHPVPAHRRSYPMVSQRHHYDSDEEPVDDLSSSLGATKLN